MAGPKELLGKVFLGPSLIGTLWNTSVDRASTAANMQNSRSYAQKVPGTMFKNCPASKPSDKIIAAVSQKALNKSGPFLQ